MELLQPHPLEYTLEKAGVVLNNTIRKLAQPGKMATSVVEKAIIKDNSWDSNEFVRIVHPLNNYGNFLTFMSVFEAAGIIPGQSTLKEHSIMLSFLMEMEGYDGILPDEPRGSLCNARTKATPQGYFLIPIRSGVHLLGNVMSENGINDLHVPCLVALLGIDSFSNMLKVIYDVNMDFYLSALANEEKKIIQKECNRRRYQVKRQNEMKRKYKDNRVAIDEIEAKSEEERTG